MKRTLLSSLLFIFFITAGCDRNKSNTKAQEALIIKYAQSTTLEGIVNNDKGGIKSGLLEVTDEKDHVISRTNLNNSHFSVEIPANTSLPILLTFSSEKTGEKYVSVVIDNTITKYFVNPTTTAIAKSAKMMGGYTRVNMIRAAEDTVHVPDANKTSTGWRGDPSSQYGGWH